MAAEVEVVTVAARPTAVVAQTTTWERFPRLWPALLDEVYAVVRRRPELAPPASPSGEIWRNVMLYKDAAPSVEVGVLVAGPFVPEGRVVASTLPGGRVARAVHRGAYAELGRTHDAIQRFAAARGLAPAGPRWEVYGHAPPDPADAETEVFSLLV